jgi:DNA-binding transcriptional MerR regulator/quercetin dioxygenase-like cupin family protein
MKEAAAFTVKKVAAMSKVSVRTLHFYDECGLLKPAYYGANGYRFYEEPQLLALQQILFYRELGLELKAIKRILGRANFQKVAALKSHRKLLAKKVARTHRLLETIDKTIHHLQGRKRMKAPEMFAGFTVDAGKDRFDAPLHFEDLSVACKVSSHDTGGALCVLEVTSGWPRHLHHEQDEWIYVIEGELVLEIGDRQLRAAAGQSVFIPRQTSHVWGPVGETSVKILNVYQPAGRIEEFFRELATFEQLITREQVVEGTYSDGQVQAMRELFAAHGMELLGPRVVAS